MVELHYKIWGRAMTQSTSPKEIDELYKAYLERLEARKERCVEPKNGGPRLAEFFKVVNTLAGQNGVTGTFIRRLKKVPTKIV